MKKSFEESYERLEKILDEMNQGQVPLEKSISLYEEADQLISSCQKTLMQAEEKIEVLIKNQEELALENQTPKTEEFQPI